MEEKKVVFLDVDGVLNSDKYPALIEERGMYGIADEHISILKSIVDRTGAHIVVSSTWRLYDEEYEWLKAKLDEFGLLCNLLGKTPTVRRKMSEMPKRCKEIQKYLDDHPEISHFVILDDDPRAEIEDHFVKTCYLTGLTERSAANAVEILST